MYHGGDRRLHTLISYVLLVLVNEIGISNILYHSDVGNAYKHAMNQAHITLVSQQTSVQTLTSLFSKGQQVESDLFGTHTSVYNLQCIHTYVHSYCSMSQKHDRLHCFFLQHVHMTQLCIHTYVCGWQLWYYYSYMYISCVLQNALYSERRWTHGCHDRTTVYSHSHCGHP